MAFQRASWILAALLIAVLAFGEPEKVAAVPVTYVVDTTSDANLTACTASAGDCSLRGAINNANATPDTDIINFALGAGTPSIAVGGTGLGPLPSVTEPVVINGDTGGATRVELNGGSAGGVANGLRIAGGNSTIRRLVINRFSGDGLQLWGGSGGNRVEGSYIGTNAAGSAAGPGNTGSSGVMICSSGNTVGGTDSSKRNVISANVRGVWIGCTGVSDNFIQGNYIGLDASGFTLLGNSAAGVQIDGPGNTVGTAARGAACSDGCNVISGNSDGIRIAAETATGNTIMGNYIGTDVGGAFDRGNVFAGITLYGLASANVIGAAAGTTPGGLCTGACNVIAGNGSDGIDFMSNSAGEAFGNFVRGNHIGLNAAGTALPNGENGVRISMGAHGNVIGGSGPGEGNVISGNGANGVQIDGMGTSGNVVQGNRIGTDSSGAQGRSNAGAGVYVAASGNTVSGGLFGGMNLIAHNGGAGIVVADIAWNVTMALNSIHSNGAMGIDLGGNGLTLNDPADTDTGANFRQNHPVLTAAYVGASTTVEGTLNSTPNTSFGIYFYSQAACDPSGHGEGETLIGGVAVATNASGDATFTAVLPTTVPIGHAITALTGAQFTGANTSEFSACEEVTAEPPTPTPPTTPTPTPTPTATPTPTGPPTATVTLPPPTATPTPTPTGMLWGDLDCDGDVDEFDAMTSLQHASGVTIAQEPGCSPIGSALGVLTFGDVNCDGRTGALDALGLLLYRAGAPNPASGCPPIGSPV